MAETETWLSGPVEGIPPHLMPVAHTLIQAAADVERVAGSLTIEQLWARPGGAASVGFHLRHIPGVVERLLTYARGEVLTDNQLAALRAEGEPGDPPVGADELLANVRRGMDAALDQLRNTRTEDLLEPRGVGRKQLPSNVLGLLFHAAEHAQRHTGQLVVTAKLVGG